MPRTYIRRSGERVRTDYRSKFYVPRWVDPYYWIQGSSIEKMVMAEFVRRGIYFEHTPQTNPLPWTSWMREMATSDPRKWEPDFLLPQYKIWIEIQGSYFHTLPGQVEADALRAVLVEQAGWKFIAWWEEDIRARLIDLMDKVPEFYKVNVRLNESYMGSNRTTPGLPFLEGGTGIDHLAGLRAALRGRARPPQNIRKRYRGPRRRPK